MDEVLWALATLLLPVAAEAFVGKTGGVEQVDEGGLADAALWDVAFKDELVGLGVVVEIEVVAQAATVAVLPVEAAVVDGQMQGWIGADGGKGGVAAGRVEGEPCDFVGNHVGVGWGGEGGFAVVFEASGLVDVGQAASVKDKTALNVVDALCVQLLLHGDEVVLVEGWVAAAYPVKVAV